MEKWLERPQHLFMTVALCIRRDNIDNAINTYKHISNKDFIHATPTLFNSKEHKENNLCVFCSQFEETLFTWGP